LTIPLPLRTIRRRATFPCTTVSKPKPSKCPKCKRAGTLLVTGRRRRKLDVRTCYVCSGCGFRFADVPDSDRPNAIATRRVRFSETG